MWFKTINKLKEGKIIMDKKLVSKLLTIGNVILLVLAMVFICLCIFVDEKNNVYLFIALSSLILSSLFNIIKRQYLKG